MSIDVVTLALSKKYTQDSLDGVGALKGSPCTIKTTSFDEDGNTVVTFAWTDTDGVEHTQNATINKGAKGDTGDQGLKGDTGEQGPKGDKGDKGDQGLQGIQGEAGPQGEAGKDGKTVQVLAEGDIIDQDAVLIFDEDELSKNIITNFTNSYDASTKIRSYTFYFVDGTHYTFSVKDGEQGTQGIQGVKGDKGDDGYPFLIYKQYESANEYNKADFPEVGLMFMIHVEDGELGYPVYRYSGGDTLEDNTMVCHLANVGIKGEKGDKGDQGAQGIQGEKGDSVYADAEFSTISTNTIQNKVITNAIGSANGIASLDANGKVPNSQLPTNARQIVGYIDAENTHTLPSPSGYSAGSEFIVTSNGYINQSTAFTLTKGSVLTELEVSQANALIGYGYVFVLTSGATTIGTVKQFDVNKVILSDDTVINLPYTADLTASSTPSTVKIQTVVGDEFINIDNHWIHMQNTSSVNSVNGKTGAVVLTIGELGGTKQWYGTQAQFDALTTKDANIDYNIYEEE